HTPKGERSPMRETEPANPRRFAFCRTLTSRRSYVRLPRVSEELPLIVEYSASSDAPEGRERCLTTKLSGRAKWRALCVCKARDSLLWPLQRLVRRRARTTCSIRAD